MLQIKTILNYNRADFDESVNSALKDGWEVTKRDCFINDHTPVFYAELEKIIDTEEDTSKYTVGARWMITRSPRHPYRCDNCGYTANEQWAVCPGCLEPMVSGE